MFVDATRVEIRDADGDVKWFILTIRRIAADFPRFLELIGEKRVGDRPDRYEPRGEVTGEATPAAVNTGEGRETVDRTRKNFL